MQVQDTYGNLKSPDSQPTVTLSSDKSGSFYDSGYNQDSTIATSSGAATVYYLPGVAGTHTITADATAYGYALGTWTIYVAPGVELYDSSNNLIKTYAPTAASPVKETDGNHGGDYVENAIDASITGDTVKLGGESGSPAIYELDTLLTVDQKITLTSKSGSDDYTTLRPTSDGMNAINVTADGTATNPITISYLTFDRKVVTGGTNLNFDMAVKNDGYDYVTVNGCTFNYVIPDNNSQHEGVVWYRTMNGAITSATISNNTFTHCGPLDLDTGVSGRSVVVYGGTDSANGVLTGLSITGNRFTDCSENVIELKGDNSSYRIVASITDNTFTRGRNCINLSNTASGSSPYGSVTITGNTFTTAYSYAIKVESDNGGVTIKNNTITGTVGTYAVTLEDPKSSAGTHYCQYNDIYDNQSYAIRGNSSANVAFDCQYNWYGSATGPAYTAATGATVGKSNSSGLGDPITDEVTYYPWLYTSKATVVTDNASYQTSTVALPVGWSTLSTPVELIPAGDTIGELIPSGRTIGYWYDAFDADADGYYWELLEDSYELSPCDSVYVKMSAAKTVQLKFDADEFTTPSKALAAGWNMIGLAYLSSSGMEADDAVASVYLTATNMPGYSQVVSSSLNDLRRDMYYTQGASWSVSRAQHGDSDVSKMYASYGYWIYMLNAATLAGHTITPIAPDLD